MAADFSKIKPTVDVGEPPVRRRLQIRGAAVATAAVIAGGANIATPRVAQMLKKDADKFNRPSKAQKQRRKQRKCQRQARKKNR